MRLLLLAVALAAFAGCPRPINPPPNPDASPDCVSACARLAALGCRAGQPTPKGRPCTDVCERAASSGVIEWDVACIARAQTCDETEGCTR